MLDRLATAQIAFHCKCWQEFNNIKLHTLLAQVLTSKRTAVQTHALMCKRMLEYNSTKLHALLVLVLTNTRTTA